MENITEIKDIMHRQRQFFHAGNTLPLSFRLQNLVKLRDMIRRNEQEIADALHQDLHKSQFESYATEIGFVLAEVRHAIKHVKSWMKPVRVRAPITHIGTKSYMHYEPYGVTLIIAPWNYPINLSIAPLVAAIAAGNCAVIKPSELAPHTSSVLARILGQTFPEDYICVVEGDVQTSTTLLEQKFDYIFFTGSTHVGKVVMEAAAKNLTPVTLELGGKSPCIVAADANLKLAAKRIAWGKFLNAGQTCIAPDYILVQKDVKEAFLQHLKEAIHYFYGQKPITSNDYTHIVNDRHFNRLASYLVQGRIVVGGGLDSQSRTIEPTVLDQVDWESPVMQEEIFGPILPIIEFNTVDDAIQLIKSRPKPLALYLFTNNSAIEDQVLRQTTYGGGCINDTVFHIAQPNLPFGGVGDSGIGGYHGKHGFELFSHKKGVLKHTTMFDLPFRYHTNKHALKRIKWFLR